MLLRVCAHILYSVKEMDACDTDGLSHLFSISTGNVTDGLAWQVQPFLGKKKKEIPPHTKTGTPMMKIPVTATS